MKLINKTIIYYLLISLPLLAIAGIFSYFLIKNELQDGIDESLAREKVNAVKIIHSVKDLQFIHLSPDSLSIIKQVTNNAWGDHYSDTSVYAKDEREYIPYRVLKSYYHFNNNNYLITVSKPTLEEDELMEGLLSSFGIIIFFLLIAFFIANWLLSKTLWKPFYKTLAKLNEYDIKKQSHPFEPVTTTEFNLLNIALNRVIDKTYFDFLHQKEFTENASHEMQTPLAVIKANVSLLMQSPEMKEEEMNQLQSIENTVKKLSALNKTLILLTRIENKQFSENAVINLKNTIVKALDTYSDLILTKNIELETDLKEDLNITLNPILAEVLVSNLIQNAIRHNNRNGKIIVAIKGQTISIANNGEALTINKQDLFRRFKKNDASADSLGLGLSIVKSIADLYGFNITYTHSGKLHIFTLNCNTQ